MTEARMFPRPLGPFWYERQAVRAAARVRGGQHTPARAAYITAGLEDTRMGLGDYDRAVARWLSTGTPEQIATVLDWMARAFEAGAVSGARVFDLTAHLDRVPDDAEVDALHEAGLADSTVDYGATGSDIDVSRVAYTREEAVATIRDQAAVAGLLAIDVEDTPDEDGAGQ